MISRSDEASSRRMTGGAVDDTVCTVSTSSQQPRGGAVHLMAKSKRLVLLAASVGILAGCGGSAHGPGTTTASSTTSGASTATSSTTSTSSATTSTTPSSASSTASSPTPPPPTAINAANCKPPAQHPYPVVLSPGTYGVTTWRLIAPQLAQLG